MSTILKALRRLEEDSSIEVDTSPGSLPATDPRAADELRSRILAEESAAVASGLDFDSGPNARNRLLKIVALAAVVALLGGIGAGLYSSRSANPSAQSLAESPPAQIQHMAGQIEEPIPPIPSRAFVASQPTFVADPGSAQASDSSHQSPTLTASSTPKKEMALAAVVPTAAVLESQSTTASSLAPRPESSAAGLSASAENPAPPSPLRPTPTPAETRTTPMQASVSAAKTPVSSTIAEGTTVAQSPSPGSRPDRDPQTTEPAPKSETKVAAKSRPDPQSDLQPKSQPKLEAGVVEQHDIRGLPDVTVLRTAWHPSPDRRSAKLRMIKTNEVLTLKEGDAVGGLVIQKISPSAVLFRSGEIEIRLRVGQPGSGG